MVTHSIKKDLGSGEENPTCLALTCVGNVGGKEFAEVLAQDVQKILVANETKNIVRKKAALTLLRLYRKYPEILPPDTWSNRVISLLSSRDYGVITSLLSLLLGLVSVNPKDYEKCVPGVVDLLTKLILNKSYTSDYVYYGIPAPWTQVKLLRLLQYYPVPEDKTMASNISTIISRIMESTERIKELDKGKTVSRTNAAHSVLFEALNVAIHYDNDVDILSNASEVLSKYLSDKDTNLRYLALDTMSRLAYSQHDQVINAIRKNQEVIFQSLKDKDISIRRRALDLLYSMCNKSNAKTIVKELEVYLQVADFAIREELILKVAILAEKFAEDFSWYVDVILGLVSQAGDFVSDDIWFRVVHIVTNSRDKELQRYTSESVFKAVTSPAAHEAAIKLAGYILGEYGHFISNQDDSSAQKQYDVFISKFDHCKNSTKAILFDTFIKFYNVHDNSTLRNKIKEILGQYRDNLDPELQQRAIEYYNLIETGDFKLIGALMKNLPVFPDRESSVLRKILERQNQVTEGQVRVVKHHNVERKDTGDNTRDSTEEIQLSKNNTKQDDILGFKVEEVKETKQTGNLIDDIFGGMLSGGNTQTTQIDDNLMNDILGGFDTKTTQKQTPQAPQIPQVKPVEKTIEKPKSTIDDIFGTFGQQETKPTGPNSGDIAKITSEIAKKKLETRENTGMGIEEIMSKTKEQELESQQRQVQEDSQKSYQSLCISSQGVVMEDSVLVISMKSEYHGPKGRIALYYGNKGGSVISQTRIDIKQIQEVKVEYSVLAPLITPGNQIAQYVTITCLEPFQKEIQASFYFEYEKKSYRFNFRLPIVTQKFVEPYQLNSQTFFQQWKTIQKGPTEKMEVLKFTKQYPDISQAKLLLAGGFGLAILEGVDENNKNLVASGKFYTEKNVYPVLVRIEGNPNINAYRVTVKSTDSIITSSVWTSIASQISN